MGDAPHDAIYDAMYIGLMSGTSMDGIDAALVSFSDANGSSTGTPSTHITSACPPVECEEIESHPVLSPISIPSDTAPFKAKLEYVHSTPYSPALRDAIAEIAQGRNDDLHTLARMDRRLGAEFARAALELLEAAGCDAAAVSAIGSHGQTVRHYPSADLTSRYSLQIADPSTIAEVTGICTVADFRRQDIAAGGQGAPLVPLFHAMQFGESEQNRAVVNIGGIANVTLLQGKQVVAGFDCGPGNTLLDMWIGLHRGQSYDAGGAWSAEHQVLPDLLDACLSDVFFDQQGPKSTGPEHFNRSWLEKKLSGRENPGDVQATLAEFTAAAIAQSLVSSAHAASQVYVCGGGGRNSDVMRRLYRRAASIEAKLHLTDEIGLAAEWVEAAAFAWLAMRRLVNLPGNAPVVTGALGPRVLGAVYPAP